MISILDYGMGNIRSVEKAFQSLGQNTEIVTSLATVEKLVIPGVGAFGAAMERLAPLRQEIRDFAASGRPLLGICLGQQLLFDSSEEFGFHEGLGLLPGTVKYFPKDVGLKVPHIGWTALDFKSQAVKGALPNGSEVYFVHSLYTECAEESDIAATATYGFEFAAAVRRENVWGAQFHPEKSSSVGLAILQNWISS